MVQKTRRRQSFLHLAIVLLWLLTLPGAAGAERLHYTLQDCYKAAYQSYWGAEHLVSDTAAVVRYIEYELSRCDTTTMRTPDIEPLGDYYRVSLRLVQRGVVTADEIVNLFIRSARPTNKSLEGWLTLWETVREGELQRHPELRDEQLIAELNQAAQQRAAVHHSTTYRDYYQPHYRLIKRELVESLPQLAPYL